MLVRSPSTGAAVAQAGGEQRRRRPHTAPTKPRGEVRIDELSDAFDHDVQEQFRDCVSVEHPSTDCVSVDPWDEPLHRSKDAVAQSKDAVAAFTELWARIHDGDLQLEELRHEAEVQLEKLRQQLHEERRAHALTKDSVLKEVEAHKATKEIAMAMKALYEEARGSLEAAVRVTEVSQVAEDVCAQTVRELEDHAMNVAAHTDSAGIAAQRLSSTFTVGVDVATLQAELYELRREREANRQSLEEAAWKAAEALEVQQKLDETLECLGEARRQISNSAQALVAREGHIAELRVLLAESESHVSALQRAAEVGNNQLRMLQAEVAHLRSRGEELTQTLARAHSERNIPLDLENEAKLREVARVSEEHARFKAEAESLREQLRIKEERDHAALSKEDLVARLSAHLQDLQQHCSDEQHLRRVAEEKIEVLQEQLQQQIEESAPKAELAALRMELADMQRQRDAVSKGVDEVSQAHLAILRKELADMQRQRDAETSALSKMLAEWQTSEDDLTALRAELAETQRQRLAETSTLREQQDQLAALRAELADVQRHREAETCAHRDELAALRAELADAHGQRETGRFTLREQQDELAALRARLVDAERQRHSETSARREQQDELAVLRAELADAQEQRKTETSALKQHQDELAALRAKLADAQEQCEIGTSALRAQKDELAAVRAELAIAQQASTTLHEQQEALAALRAQLADAHRQRENETASLREQLAKVLLLECQEDAPPLQDELAALRAELADARRQHEAETAWLREQIEVGSGQTASHMAKALHKREQLQVQLRQWLNRTLVSERFLLLACAFSGWAVSLKSNKLLSMLSGTIPFDKVAKHVSLHVHDHLLADVCSVWKTCIEDMRRKKISQERSRAKAACLFAKSNTSLKAAVSWTWGYQVRSGKERTRKMQAFEKHFGLSDLATQVSVVSAWRGLASTERRARSVKERCMKLVEHTSFSDSVIQFSVFSKWRSTAHAEHRNRHVKEQYMKMVTATARERLDRLKLWALLIWFQFAGIQKLQEDTLNFQATASEKQAKFEADISRLRGELLEKHSHDENTIPALEYNLLREEHAKMLNTHQVATEKLESTTEELTSAKKELAAAQHMLECKEEELTFALKELQSAKAELLRAGGEGRATADRCVGKASAVLTRHALGEDLSLQRYILHAWKQLVAEQTAAEGRGRMASAVLTRLALGEDLSLQQFILHAWMQHRVEQAAADSRGRMASAVLTRLALGEDLSLQQFILHAWMQLRVGQAAANSRAGMASAVLTRLALGEDCSLQQFVLHAWLQFTVLGKGQAAADSRGRMASAVLTRLALGEDFSLRQFVLHSWMQLSTFNKAKAATDHRRLMTSAVLTKLAAEEDFFLQQFTMHVWRLQLRVFEQGQAATDSCAHMASAVLTRLALGEDLSLQQFILHVWRLQLKVFSRARTASPVLTRLASRQLLVQHLHIWACAAKTQRHNLRLQNQLQVQYYVVSRDLCIKTLMSWSFSISYLNTQQSRRNASLASVSRCVLERESLSLAICVLWWKFNTLRNQKLKQAGVDELFLKEHIAEEQRLQQELERVHRLYQEALDDGERLQEKLSLASSTTQAEADRLREELSKSQKYQSLYEEAVQDNQRLREELLSTKTDTEKFSLRELSESQKLQQLYDEAMNETQRLREELSSTSHNARIEADRLQGELHEFTKQQYELSFKIEALERGSLAAKEAHAALQDDRRQWVSRALASEASLLLVQVFKSWAHTGKAENLRMMRSRTTDMEKAISNAGKAALVHMAHQRALRALDKHFVAEHEALLSQCVTCWRDVCLHHYRKERILQIALSMITKSDALLQLDVFKVWRQFSSEARKSRHAKDSGMSRALGMMRNCSAMLCHEVFGSWLLVTVGSRQRRKAKDSGMAKARRMASNCFASLLRRCMESWADIQLQCQRREQNHKRACRVIAGHAASLTQICFFQWSTEYCNCKRKDQNHRRAGWIISILSESLRSTCFDVWLTVWSRSKTCRNLKEHNTARALRMIVSSDAALTSSCLWLWIDHAHTVKARSRKAQGLEKIFRSPEEVLQSMILCSWWSAARAKGLERTVIAQCTSSGAAKNARLCDESLLMRLVIAWAQVVFATAKEKLEDCLREAGVVAGGCQDTLGKLREELSEKAALLEAAEAARAAEADALQVSREECEELRAACSQLQHQVSELESRVASSDLDVAQMREAREELVRQREVGRVLWEAAEQRWKDRPHVTATEEGTVEHGREERPFTSQEEEEFERQQAVRAEIRQQVEIAERYCDEPAKALKELHRQLVETKDEFEELYGKLRCVKAELDTEVLAHRDNRKASQSAQADFEAELLRRKVIGEQSRTAFSATLQRHTLAHDLALQSKMLESWRRCTESAHACRGLKAQSFLCAERYVQMASHRLLTLHLHVWRSFVSSRGHLKKLTHGLQAQFGAEQRRLCGKLLHEWHATAVEMCVHRSHKEPFIERVSGADVAGWFKRFLIQERVRATKHQEPLDKDAHLASVDRCVRSAERTLLAVYFLSWTLVVLRDRSADKAYKRECQAKQAELEDAGRTVAELRAQAEQMCQDKLLVKMGSEQRRSAALSVLRRQAMAEDSTLKHTILKSWRQHFFEASEHRVDKERNILQTRRYAAAMVKRVETKWLLWWFHCCQVRRSSAILMRGMEAQTLARERELTEIVFFLWHDAAVRSVVQLQQRRSHFNCAARYVLMSVQAHLGIYFLGWSLLSHKHQAPEKDESRDEEQSQAELAMRNRLATLSQEEERLMAELEELRRLRQFETDESQKAQELLQDALAQANEMQAKWTESQRQQFVLSEQLEDMRRQRQQFEGELAMYQERDNLFKDAVEMSRQATARLAKNEERLEQLYRELDTARRLRDEFQQERDEFMRKLHDSEILVERLRSQEGRDALDVERRLDEMLGIASQTFARNQTEEASLIGWLRRERDDSRSRLEQAERCCAELSDALRKRERQLVNFSAELTVLRRHHQHCSLKKSRAAFVTEAELALLGLCFRSWGSLKSRQATTDAGAPPEPQEDSLKSRQNTTDAGAHPEPPEEELSLEQWQSDSLIGGVSQEDVASTYSGPSQHVPRPPASRPSSSGLSRPIRPNLGNLGRPASAIGPRSTAGNRAAIIGIGRGKLVQQLADCSRWSGNPVGNDGLSTATMSTGIGTPEAVTTHMPGAAFGPPPSQLRTRPSTAGATVRPGASQQAFYRGN